jgi:hypothetical protein
MNPKRFLEDRGAYHLFMNCAMNSYIIACDEPPTTEQTMAYYRDNLETLLEDDDAIDLILNWRSSAPVISPEDPDRAVRFWEGLHNDYHFMLEEMAWPN